jgi:hypothetical protein
MRLAAHHADIDEREVSAAYCPQQQLNRRDKR